MQQVYFDNAATTQIRDEIIGLMTEVMRNNYGNASSTHSFGRSSKSLVEQARKEIAARFNVTPGEIIFTSGGTEADNLVLKSAVKDLEVAHVITSRIEHHAVLHTIEELQKCHGIDVSYVKITPSGDIDYEDLERLLNTNRKTLVSLMHINNEIGNIMDIERVANLCQLNNALFHSDTVQSIGHYHMDLQEIPIDFLAASAHKFHGPKGVGFAFIRKNSGLKPLIIGGEQERGFRAGTECVHNIVGLNEALKMSYDNLEREKTYVKSLKQHFISKIKTEIPEVKFNGNSENLDKSTYVAVNICVPVDEKKASMLLFQLDLKGIACSKGSACQSGSIIGSHVLREILCDEDLKKPSLRFSFSIYNTTDEIDYAIESLKEFVEK